jgi:phenylacetate-CoA ligase
MAGTVYAALPSSLQHLATAIYGVRMRWIRNSGSHRSTRAMLERTQWLPADELGEHQRGELVRIASHAVRASPFWAKRFRDAGLQPEALRDLGQLRRLPLLDKKTVRDHADDLRARGVDRVRTYYTSGTTGTALAVPIDDASRQKNYAFFARALSWAGVEGGSSATFAGRPILRSDEPEPKTVWRWNPAMRNRLFSSYHLSAANAPAYSGALCAFSPDYIDSYPSAVATLARLFRDLGLPAPRPRAMITTAETLLDQQRELILEVFGAPCFDQYGCTEQAVYISQCEAGTYHVHPEYGIVEILDPDGQPAAPGEKGELVCTSFTNYALPLLRYRIGDVAVAGEPGCSCKRAFPVIRELVGRMDDQLVTPDGRSVGRLDPAFKGGLPIREAQVLQKSSHEVLLRIVAGPGYTSQDGESVASELIKRLSPDMRITVETVPSIERTASGKFRAVVNLMNRATGKTSEH